MTITKFQLGDVVQINGNLIGTVRDIQSGKFNAALYTVGNPDHPSICISCDHQLQEDYVACEHELRLVFSNRLTVYGK